MDSLTHIYFAHHLLEMASGEVSAAVCSLFPQIDRQPAYFHRMYAHPFHQMKKLAPLGASAYRGDAIAEIEPSYALQRFIDDVPRMHSFMEQYSAETRCEFSAEFNPDMLSIMLSYVSHTYQDIFNNPMQAFLPASVYPSGKWEFWSELDPIEFRLVLYSPDNIAAFRHEFFSSSLWQAKLDGIALVKAMIRRTAAASIVQLPVSVVDGAFASLKLDCDPTPADVRTAEEFLLEHEHLLTDMIRKYAVPLSLPALQTKSPVGS